MLIPHIYHSFSFIIGIGKYENKLSNANVDKIFVKIKYALIVPKQNTDLSIIFNSTQQMKNSNSEKSNNLPKTIQKGRAEAELLTQVNLTQSSCS